MINSNKEIYVYENYSELEPLFIGTLYVNVIRGEEVYSFSYDKDYLKNKNTKIVLDPNIMLYDGRQFLNINKSTFGVFDDSSPDRWGRLLMQRKEAEIARNEDRKPNKLLESDYLLGVYDASRSGALRFKLDKEGTFVNADERLIMPPLVTLRTLEEAARNLEKDNDKENKYLNQIIMPGSSLGGARPKANVVDEKGEIWIAKFPSKNDDVDKGAWEKVSMDLAKLYKLNVPETRLEKLSKYDNTFLTKRFDRYFDKENKCIRRIHMASAMTLLNKTDNESASYLDIVLFIKENSGNPKEDLLELYKRLLFNIAISNCDDHLRNHAFIIKDNKWRLSPLYDVNPLYYGKELELDIVKSNREMNFDLALSSAKYYDIQEDIAKKLIKDVKKIVKNNYIELAKKYGIKNSEIEKMKDAFRLCLD